MASDRRTEKVAILASTTLTTGSAVIPIGDLGAYNELNIYFVVTAEGTTLDFDFEDSPDDVNYASHTSHSQITETGVTALRLNNIGKFGRLAYTADGSFTLEIWGAKKT